MINNDTKLVWGSKTIIDDILLWCSHSDDLLVIMECVCEVFQKYRVSFRLKKCDFLKDRVEYVGHDITANGNCPAKSKFDMINEWKLPPTGQSLSSFVGLINFYHKYIPYFELKLKPLRQLCRKFFRKTIPTEAWTPTLITLFNEMKTAITSSPVCARFDPYKPIFLKTDWSAEGMGYILMQPDESEESRAAMKLFKETGDCVFDLTKSGPRLKPVTFGSRACNDIEKRYHSFVAEAGCGRCPASMA